MKKIIIGTVLSIITLTVLSCGPSISYSVRRAYTDQGGAASIGYIRLNGVAIPPVFTLVISENGTTFRFFQITGAGGPAGYHPVQPLSIAGDTTVITGEELQRGWYLGRTRHLETPAQWIFVAWPRGSAMVSPCKIDVLVKELNLEPLPLHREKTIEI